MPKNKNAQSAGTGKKMNSKRIVALVGVGLLIFLYIATLIAAIVDRSDSGRWFMTCIFATVAVPMLIWIYTWIYGKLTGRRTIADSRPGQSPDASETPDEDSRGTP